jgi:N-acetyl-anhydromuramyl-L-alanine amidase AmpD
MRNITHIIIHCSATLPGQTVTTAIIDAWHRQRGYDRIGYHYVIMPDGTVEKGREEETVGAHCNGYNTNSLGICYIGGLDNHGRCKDTRTPEQKEALRSLVAELCRRHPITRIAGHRDYSPDLNRNGRVESHEWTKTCPCFDVKAEFQLTVDS